MFYKVVEQFKKTKLWIDEQNTPLFNLYGIGCIASVDEGVGKVLDFLKENNLDIRLRKTR